MHEIYALIGPDHGPITWWQMTLRGVLTFLYGLALVRLAGLRSLSRQTALDIMLAILIGSNLSRALTQGSPISRPSPPPPESRQSIGDSSTWHSATTWSAAC